MTANNCPFINTFYYPPPEEMARRWKLQDDIINMRNTIINEANRTNYPKYFGVIYFNRFYELRRKEIKILKNPVCNLSLVDSHSI